MASEKILEIGERGVVVRRRTLRFARDGMVLAADINGIFREISDGLKNVAPG